MTIEKFRRETKDKFRTNFIEFFSNKKSEFEFYGDESLNEILTEFKEYELQ